MSLKRLLLGREDATITSNFITNKTWRQSPKVTPAGGFDVLHMFKAFVSFH